MRLSADASSLSQFALFLLIRISNLITPGFGQGDGTCALSNEGKRFMLGFLPNLEDQEVEKSRLELYVMHRGSEGADTITVEMFNQQGFVASKTIGRYEMARFDVAAEMEPPYEQNNMKSINKAFELTSESPFIVYGFNKAYFTTDGFLGLPVEALGTEYYATCHYPMTNQCQFAVIATEDDTDIMIELGRKVFRYDLTRNSIEPLNDVASPCNELTLVNEDQPPNDALRRVDRRVNNQFAEPIPLGRLQYSRRRTRQANNCLDCRDMPVTLMRKFDMLLVQAKCDLTGARITSNKKVTVFSGNARTAITDEKDTRDHLVEQLPPVEYWGSDCVATDTPRGINHGEGDFWTITAGEDNVRVTIEASVAGVRRKQTLSTMNAGQTARIWAKDYENTVDNGREVFRRIPFLIKAEDQKKILVMRYVQSQVEENEKADPAMILCVPTTGFLRYAVTLVTPYGIAVDYASNITLVTSSVNSNIPVRVKLNGTGVLTWSPDWATVDKGVNFKTSTLRNGDLNNRFSQVQRVEMELEGGVPFASYVYGAGSRESYGFPGGICLKNHIQAPIDPRCFSTVSKKICYDTADQLSCTSGTLKIISAHFGRISSAGENTCGGPNAVSSGGQEVDCGLTDIYSPVKTQCEGKSDCLLEVTLYTLGNIRNPSSRCPLCNQYAWVVYTCLDGSRNAADVVLAGRDGAEHPRNYAASSSASRGGASADTCPAGGGLGERDPAGFYTGGCPDCDAGMNSWWTDPSSPAAARFSTGARDGWRPAVCDRKNPWLEIDLGGHYEINGYLVQGCRADNAWVSSLGISYSSDGVTWTELRGDDGAWVKQQGNVDAENVVWCTLNNIVARYVRAHVINYSGQPCMHFDISRSNRLRGCQAQIIDNSNMVGQAGRLGTPITVKCNNGWRTALGDKQYTVNCDQSGQWTGNFQRCSEAYGCGDIPRVTEGLHDGVNTNIGSQATYRCQNGRSMSGTATVICRRDGTWSEAPSCS